MVSVTFTLEPQSEVNMQTQELIESLKEYIESLDTEKIEKIDFDQLLEDLKAVTEALILLQRKENLCDQLFSDFKSDIKRMSFAISRAKSDLKAPGLVEKLLSSENLSFEELILMREKVREDFNKTFPAKPQAKVVDTLGFGGFKINEFKTGAKE
jgi:chorismate mutase